MDSIAGRGALAGVCLLIYLICPNAGWSNIWKSIETGERLKTEKLYEQAGKAFAMAVEENPEGFRALKGLAEVQVLSGKYEEAERTIQKILALEVTSGRKVLVFLKDVEEPQEAELVDETVLKEGTRIVEKSAFVKPGTAGIKTFFRLYYLKTGKMALVSKETARIKYIGIPRVIRERVEEMDARVKREVIASSVSENKPELNEMTEIQGGCFLMGSTRGDADERPIHEVCVSSFKIDTYEVTQAQFQYTMGRNPSHFLGPDLPVDSMTWMDGNDYCQKLGKRLPTEAEWEFAARAGTKTEFYWGEEVVSAKANFCDSACELNVRLETVSDGFKHTAPVGSFPPNQFGLYDMAGNVSEWVGDSYHEGYYIISPKDNPQGYVPVQKAVLEKGPEVIFLAERSASRKVVRGGAWENDALSLRSASRKVFYPGYRIEGVGFRCAKDL